jgi:hypothetical protein
MIVFANFLGPIQVFSVLEVDNILAFLDTRIRNTEIDPDKRWITTGNDYLWRIKYFLRWLYNHKEKEEKGWKQHHNQIGPRLHLPISRRRKQSV